MNEQGPDYARIYTDIILMKCPDKFEICKPILQKKMTVLEVLKLNQIVFGFNDFDTEQFNRRHKFYDRSAIIELLNFQKIKGYNNTEMARKFNISRNTLAKWKKMFLE